MFTKGKQFLSALQQKRANIAIVGITGAVGQELMQLMQTRSFPFNNIKFLASANSKGKQIDFLNKQYIIEELTPNSFTNNSGSGSDSDFDVDLAFFCANNEQSLKYAPIAAEAGAIVIDNSSVFRLDKHVPLIIPEINAHILFDAVDAHTRAQTNTNEKKGLIISNPNCSTILLNIAVYPIHARVGISRIIVSTYQAASGAGISAMNELEQQAREWNLGYEHQQQQMTCDIFGRQYIWNLFSHNSLIDEDTGYNAEELKIINETKKIFADEQLQISATCVRVPVLRAHCESINLTLSNPLTANQARDLLQNSPGIKIVDNWKLNQFPEPINSSFCDECFVGRIRQDLSQSNNTGLELFLSGDQIRKGAALNAIQIAELLL